jgi:AcrR family transcriptional regulator
MGEKMVKPDNDKAVKSSRAITGQQKAERREILVKAAAEQMLEEGLERVTIGSIAKRAGYSKGTLYLYFQSKGEIVNAVYDYELESWAKEFDAALNEGLGDKAFCELFWNVSRRDRLFFQLLAIPPVGWGDPEEDPDNLRRRTLRQLRSHKTSGVLGIFEKMESVLGLRPGDGRYLALVLWAMMVGGSAMDVDELMERQVPERFNLLKAKDFYLRFGPMAIASVRAEGS